MPHARRRSCALTPDAWSARGTATMVNIHVRRCTATSIDAAADMQHVEAPGCRRLGVLLHQIAGYPGIHMALRAFARRMSSHITQSMFRACPAAPRLRACGTHAAATAGMHHQREAGWPGISRLYSSTRQAAMQSSNCVCHDGTYWTGGLLLQGWQPQQRQQQRHLSVHLRVCHRRPPRQAV